MKSLLRFSIAMVASFLVTAAAVGCGDETTNDFSADCSLCVNDTPVGPSASMTNCTAWGALFSCGSVTLINAGMCGDIAATCQVSQCASDPVDCTIPE